MVLVDSIPDYKRTAGDDRNNLNIAGNLHKSNNRQSE